MVVSRRGSTWWKEEGEGEGGRVGMMNVCAWKGNAASLLAVHLCYEGVGV